MFSRFKLLVLALIVAGNAAFAEYKIVTDIRPTTGLVQMITGTLATPIQLLEGDGSSHHVQLKPSQVQQLHDADLVVWMGAGMTPALAPAIENLPASVRVLDLSKSPSKMETEDPHLWLNPEYVLLFLSDIKEQLRYVDSTNVNLHYNNMEDIFENLFPEMLEMRNKLSDQKDAVYFVGHDALGHFETWANIQKQGAFSSASDHQIKPSSLKAFNEAVKQSDVCLLIDPTEAEQVKKIIPKGAIVHVEEIDPLGKNVPLDNEFYTNLMTNLVVSVERCLTASSANK